MHCSLVNRGETLSITAHEGESVLLPCSCTDLNSTPDTFSWWKHNTISYRYEEISSESDQYRNRVQLFNNLSPANLSLLISHLTEEDDGYYSCKVKHGEFRYISLTVKDCTLVNRGKALRITAHKGESVLLPCSCTDLNSTPDTFSWWKRNTISYRWEEISSESDQYRNRVQLFNNLSPANLSLLISHLTEEDAGVYSCNVKHCEFTDIGLTVKGKTLLFSHSPISCSIIGQQTYKKEYFGCSLHRHNGVKWNHALAHQHLLLPNYLSQFSSAPMSPLGALGQLMSCSWRCRGQSASLEGIDLFQLWLLGF
uniref:Ig-like domain-containing protein n=1 Tax=Astyanax mexicanus TaxID=7994 RepID=W5LA87_ASTMX